MLANDQLGCGVSTINIEITVRENRRMIYEYKCNDCDHQFEVWAKVSDPAPSECPSCKSAQLEKVIFATNFALKGGGWYAQGYGSGDGKQSSTAKAANKSVGNSTEKSTTVKSDSAKAGS